MPILWERTDGSIAVTQLMEDYLAAKRLDGETTAEAVLRLAKTIQAKDQSLTGLTPVLVKGADMPADRSARHAWRLKDGAVVADPAIPKPVTAAEQVRADLLALDPKAVKPEDLPGIVERLQKIL